MTYSKLTIAAITITAIFIGSITMGSTSFAAETIPDSRIYVNSLSFDVFEPNTLDSCSNITDNPDPCIIINPRNTNDFPPTEFFISDKELKNTRTLISVNVHEKDNFPAPVVNDDPADMDLFLFPECRIVTLANFGGVDGVFVECNEIGIVDNEDNLISNVIDVTYSFTGVNQDFESNPTITLIKEVTDASADPDDFGISIDGIIVLSGSTTFVSADINHIIDEVGFAGYDFVSITGDAECPTELGGTVNLPQGQNITCTITNMPASLCEDVTIDFAGLPHGAVLGDYDFPAPGTIHELYAPFGIEFSAYAKNSSNGEGLNTIVVYNANANGRDSDLEHPFTGQDAGDNSDANIVNMMVIPQDDKDNGTFDNPSDWKKGGSITLKFADERIVKSLKMVDDVSSSSKVKLWDAGKANLLHTELLNNNDDDDEVKFYDISPDVGGVKVMKIKYHSSGAPTQIVLGCGGQQ